MKVMNSYEKINCEKYQETLKSTNSIRNLIKSVLYKSTGNRT